MNYKRIIFTVFTLWITATFFVCSIKADDKADSIRMLMENLSGGELLWSHYSLCRMAAAEDNSDAELATIKAYINEAGRQADLKAEGLARGMLIDCYYNYGMFDSLKLALPEILAFMAKHGLWDRYYNAWNVLVEHYIYDNKL